MISIPRPPIVIPGHLTRSLRERVPSVSGIVVMDNEIVVKRATGEFNPEEVAALREAIEKYDPTPEIEEEKERKDEVQKSPFSKIRLFQVDEEIDGINNLAQMKVFMKKFVRYVIATRG